MKTRTAANRYQLLCIIALALFFPLIINGCGGSSGGSSSDDDKNIPITCTDSDNDSYYAQIGCGTAVDCNDQNAKINPGRAEICNDLIDNDCDGNTDCSDSDCSGDPSCSTGDIAIFGTAKFDAGYVFDD